MALSFREGYGNHGEFRTRRHTWGITTVLLPQSLRRHGSFQQSPCLHCPTNAWAGSNHFFNRIQSKKNKKSIKSNVQNVTLPRIFGPSQCVLKKNTMSPEKEKTFEPCSVFGRRSNPPNKKKQKQETWGSLFLVPGFLFHNNHNFMALWVMSYTYVLCSPKKSPCSWPDQHLAILKTGGSGRNRRSNWQVTKRNKKHSDVLLGRFYEKIMTEHICHMTEWLLKKTMFCFPASIIDS